jgi:uncharacterized protein (DUF2267 family)
MEQDEFLTKVAQQADVSLEKADALTSATLRTLAERISGGEAEDLAAQLPTELKPFLMPADEPAQPFDAEEFVRRVADRAGTDPDQATAGVRAVFTTLREAVTPGEIDDITSQLPKDLRGLIGAPS